jgi:uncharacterized membrane protein YeiH
MTTTLLLEHLSVATAAVSGVLAAAGRRIDFFGVIVLAGVTAFGGGTLRDLLLGALPPPWLRNPSLLHTVLIAAVVTFFAARWLRFPQRVLLVADAGALALFTIIGTQKGMSHGLPPTAAIVTGVVTGVAGGMLRDALLREVPLVFRREIHLYATAGFLGAAMYALAPRGSWHTEPVIHAAAVTVILGLRLAAIKWRLALPDFVARGS